MTNAQEKKLRKADKGFFDKVDRQCDQSGICTGGGGALSEMSALTFLF